MSNSNQAEDKIAARSAAVTELLSERFPTYRTPTKKAFDFSGLARDMGFSHETLYRVGRQVEETKIPVARRIIEFSRESPVAKPIYWRELLPFVLHDWAVYGEPGPAECDDDDVDDLLA